MPQFLLSSFSSDFRIGFLATPYLLIFNEFYYGDNVTGNRWLKFPKNQGIERSVIL